MLLFPRSIYYAISLGGGCRQFLPHARRRQLRFLSYRVISGRLDECRQEIARPRNAEDAFDADSQLID